MTPTERTIKCATEATELWRTVDEALEIMRRVIDAGEVSPFLPQLAAGYMKLSGKRPMFCESSLYDLRDSAKAANARYQRTNRANRKNREVIEKEQVNTVLNTPAEMAQREKWVKSGFSADIYFAHFEEVFEKLCLGQPAEKIHKDIMAREAI